MQSVSQSGSIASVQRAEFVPHSVRTLDALINHNIAHARPGAEQDSWLRVKADVKRRLVALPAQRLDDETRIVLGALRPAGIEAGRP